VARPASANKIRFVAISPDDGSAIDLKNPAVAALLSWLVPGLGQVYQGRFLKGGIFMTSLVAALLAGLWIGGGNVVYASWRPAEKRWAFLCQAGIGAAALPAMLQSYLVNGPAKQPLGASPWFTPPLVRGQLVSEAYARRLSAGDPDISVKDFRPQPGGMTRYEPSQAGGQLSLWHLRLGRLFDIGSLYTMLAGLLNLLVIYDAWAGPMRQQAGDDDKDDETSPQPGKNAAR
jgi:MFS family permease